MLYHHSTLEKYRTDTPRDFSTMIYVKAKTVTFSITRGNSLHIMFSRWPQIPLEKIKFRKNTRICLHLFTSNRTIEKRKTAVGLS